METELITKQSTYPDDNEETNYSDEFASDERESKESSGPLEEDPQLEKLPDSTGGERPLHDAGSFDDSFEETVGEYSTNPSSYRYDVYCTDFVVEGWLSQYFFETCCESCCFPVRRIDLSMRKVYDKIGRKLINTDIPPLLVFLRNNPDVITINVAYNDIGDSGFINLIEHADLYQNIFGLNVSYNKVTRRGIEYMLFFEETLNIKSLQLKGNRLMSEGVDQLSEFLETNSHIIDLDMSEVGQTVQSLSRLINALNPIHEPSNKSLKIIDLSRPSTSTRCYPFNADVVADWLGRLLKGNSRLLGVRAQKYGFSCHDIEALMTNARYNKSLISLDLGCNNIGDHGLRAICDWLATRPALKILSLERNIITDHGARDLSISLPYSKLLLLDISYNRITDDGMVAILNTLKKTPQLRCLKIFGNQMCEPSAQIVRRMVISKVLRQENIDVRAWSLDDKWQLARYECEPCELKYFLQPCCREPQLASGCRTREAYRRRYLQYTKFYERIDDEPQETVDPEAAPEETMPTGPVSCDKKVQEPKVECNCCNCLRIKERTKKSLAAKYTRMPSVDYIGLGCLVFKEVGSNRSVASLNLDKPDYCPEIGADYIGPILESVTPEVGAKIRRWINMDDNVLQEDQEEIARLAMEGRSESDESEEGGCRFLPVSISSILRYLEDEPANILLIRQADYVDFT